MTSLQFGLGLMGAHVDEATQRGGVDGVSGQPSQSPPSSEGVAVAID